MTGRPPRAALALFVIIMAVMAPVAAGTALGANSDSEDTVTLPTDIPINSDEIVQKWKQKDVVTTEVGAPQMTITIGTERDHVDAGFTFNPLKGDTRNDFIRITHREDMTRTVQIPIRADYWEPFPREDLESLDESHTAALEPIQQNGEQFTLITVTFQGEDTAVFPLPEDAVAVYSAAERTEKNTNATFGIDLGLTPSPWSRVPDGVFGNRTAVRIEGNPDTMIIEYNDGTPEDPYWLTVPGDRKRNVPVYTLEKDDVPGAVYVVSTTEDPPAIRYKAKASWGDRVGLAIREARSIPSRIADGFGMELPSVNLFVLGYVGVSY